MANVVYVVRRSPDSNGALPIEGPGRIKMTSNLSNDGEKENEKKIKTTNGLGAIIAIFVFFLICICVYLVTEDKARKSTTERYELRIENLKKNHKIELNNSIERYKTAMKTQKLKSEHSQRLAELARIQDAEIHFQMALTGAITKLQPKLDRKIADRISAEIVVKCKSKGLDPILVTALIWVESRFDPLAHSSKGAVGLMQVRYSTWKETSILKNNGVSAKHKLYWIDLNIECGTNILAKYYKEAKGNMVKTLYRYNTGSRTIPADRSVTEITYINRIMLTAYEISDFIQKGKSGSVEEP